MSLRASVCAFFQKGIPTSEDERLKPLNDLLLLHFLPVVSVLQKDIPIDSSLFAFDFTSVMIER